MARAQPFIVVVQSVGTPSPATGRPCGCATILPDLRQEHGEQREEAEESVEPSAAASGERLECLDTARVDELRPW